ncbi:MAG: DUF512 domain-containing protein [Coriobacteriales bacterium]|jgi:NifB/MoaA-like Fe-S oxidoreductase|nr:DUF512 domain-containing protein [Coriobacteriales bacterium]
MKAEITGAVIAFVDTDSPAAQAGIKAGMRILSVDGMKIRDVIEWQWFAADDVIELVLDVADLDVSNLHVGDSGGLSDSNLHVGDSGGLSDSNLSDNATLNVVLERQPGKPWGIEFSQPVFDNVRLCNNDCLFCFMKMLPGLNLKKTSDKLSQKSFVNSSVKQFVKPFVKLPDKPSHLLADFASDDNQPLRSSLYLRDDDYRLSFLQGNFVTLTNLNDDDVNRIISQRIMPLNVSLHAIDFAARERLMGKNHARGITALEKLLAADIQVNAQIVLVPGYNDGVVLDETLDWVCARPNITTAGIVPYGFTKFAKLQRGFTSQEAKSIVQKCLALAPKIQLADEFFCQAFPNAVLENLPLASYYASYDLLEDGIGMLRQFADLWINAQLSGSLSSIKRAKALAKSQVKSQAKSQAKSQMELQNQGRLKEGMAVPILATATAFASFLVELGEHTGLGLPFKLLPIKNNFFGGNVDVAGLLTAKDVICQLNAYLKKRESSLSVNSAEDSMSHTSSVAVKAINGVKPVKTQVLLNKSMFNDDGLTLDGLTLVDIQIQTGCQVILADVLEVFTKGF